MHGDGVGKDAMRSNETFYLTEFDLDSIYISFGDFISIEKEYVWSRAGVSFADKCLAMSTS